MQKLLTTFCIIILFSTVANAKLVVDSRQNGVLGIYTMDDDGSNVTLLTETLSPCCPSWSPRGNYIVFQRRSKPWDARRYHLFIMNSDGTNIQQLTPPHAGTDVHPSFSPDGKSILFSRVEILEEEVNNKDFVDRISILDLESGRIKHISNLGANDPRFSPNGKEIVFSTIPFAGGEGGNIWIMNADGRNARALLPRHQGGGFVVSRWNPTWSPDGTKILYTEDRNRIAKIDGVIHSIPLGYHYLICNNRGEPIDELDIPTNLRPSYSDWMEDGKYIIFTAAKVKLNQLPPPDFRINYNIYKYHISSRTFTPVTTDPEDLDFEASWISDAVYPVSPAGKLTTQWCEIKTLPHMNSDSR